MKRLEQPALILQVVPDREFADPGFALSSAMHPLVVDTMVSWSIIPTGPIKARTRMRHEPRTVSVSGTVTDLHTVLTRYAIHVAEES